MGGGERDLQTCSVSAVFEEVRPLFRNLNGGGLGHLFIFSFFSYFFIFFIFLLVFSLLVLFCSFLFPEKLLVLTYHIRLALVRIKTRFTMNRRVFKPVG